MKRSELKKMIKECVKEVLFEEEGILSSVIAEVTLGLAQAQNLLEEQKTAKITKEQKEKVSLRATEEDERARKQLLETKRKMLDAIGKETMQGVFEGTEPLRGPTTPAHSPLAGRDQSDAGIDISGLFSVAGKKWNALK